MFGKHLKKETFYIVIFENFQIVILQSVFYASENLCVSIFLFLSTNYGLE